MWAELWTELCAAQGPGALGVPRNAIVDKREAPGVHLGPWARNGLRGDTRPPEGGARATRARRGDKGAVELLAGLFHLFFFFAFAFAASGSCPIRIEMWGDFRLKMRDR